MKVACFLLFTLTLFLFSDAAIAARRVDCRGYPRQICPAVYAPVCATNGVTYSNLCYFCNAHVRSGRRIRLRRFGRCRQFEDAQD